MIMFLGSDIRGIDISSWMELFRLLFLTFIIFVGVSLVQKKSICSYLPWFLYAVFSMITVIGYLSYFSGLKGDFLPCFDCCPLYWEPTVNSIPVSVIICMSVFVVLPLIIFDALDCFEKNNGTTKKWIISYVVSYVALLVLFPFIVYLINPFSYFYGV